MSETPKTHPMSYLPIPADSPQVTVYDHRVDNNWLGFVHDGIIHDASGTIHPEDIGFRYSIYRDGIDVSEEFWADHSDEG